MVLFWLRHETKEMEERTALLPSHVQLLLQSGHQVCVERSCTRCVPDSEYEAIPGCDMVAQESWETQAPSHAVILGLKELPAKESSLEHQHIMFGHCYKSQVGWHEFLDRFHRGGGILWDLEFLMYPESGRRVAAFGRSAGYCGMAVGFQCLAHQLREKGTSQMPALRSFPSKKALNESIRESLAGFGGVMDLKVLVIGALGRCGGGAVAMATDLGLPLENITRWDVAETRAGGPFPEMVTDYDILVNCINLTGKIPPFLTDDMLDVEDRRLRVFVDVSCDYTSPFNPFPIYSCASDFNAPNIRIRENPPMDVVSIDHLPSLVPWESTLEFAQDLVPHLCNFPDTLVWTGALEWFEKKKAEALVYRQSLLLNSEPCSPSSSPSSSATTTSEVPEVERVRACS